MIRRVAYNNIKALRGEMRRRQERIKGPNGRVDFREQIGARSSTKNSQGQT